MVHEFNWGLPVIAYLFLAGVGAGAVTVSASILLRSGGGHGNRHFALARYGAFLGPVLTALGTTLIVGELGRPFRMFNLFKLINLSPMNIGSWLLILFLFTSLFYAFTFLPAFWPWLKVIIDKVKSYRTALAWINIPLGIGVALYTGIMLGAMPARPLWNSPILALLFLVSALSTAVAAILLTAALSSKKSASKKSVSKQSPSKEPTDESSNYHQSAYLLSASDLILIGLELTVIFLFVLFAHLTIGNVKYAIETLLPGGEMAATFWFWIVGVGLLFPAILEMRYVLPKLLYQKSYHAPRFVEIVVSLCVLIGGFMLRYVIVIAGQLTGPVGL